jgi:hypothetical protein
MLRKTFVFINIFLKIWYFREKICFLNIVTSWLSCPLCLVQVIYQADLSSPTCFGCPVPDVLSKMLCPNPCQECPLETFLSRLFCPGCPCPGCPVWVVLSQMSYITQQPRLFHPGYPILAVPSLLSCWGRSAFPFLAVLLCDVAELKNKLMGVMVYFQPAEK